MLCGSIRIKMIDVMVFQKAESPGPRCPLQPLLKHVSMVYIKYASKCCFMNHTALATAFYV